MHDSHVTASDLGAAELAPAELASAELDGSANTGETTPTTAHNGIFCARAAGDINTSNIPARQRLIKTYGGRNSFVRTPGMFSRFHRALSGEPNRSRQNP